MTIALPSSDKVASASFSPEFNVVVSEMGDNYERVSANGINSTRGTANITYCVMPEAEGQILFDALKGTNGTEQITWTPNGEATQRVFRLTSVQKGYTGTVNVQINATLREVFV